MSNYILPRIKCSERFEELIKNPILGTDINYIENLESILSLHRICVVAEPGYGKTRLLSEIYELCIRQGKKSAIIDLKKVNVRLENFLKNEDILKFKDSFEVDGLSKSENFKLNNSEDVIICLDALDEVKNDRFNETVDWIIEFSKCYDNIILIVSCRTNFINKKYSLFEDASFRFLSIEKFTEEEVMQYCVFRMYPVLLSGYSRKYCPNNPEYAFNFICLILEVVYELKKNNDFNNKNYSLISSKPDEPLAQYVNENIDEYITIILDNCSERITDEEPAVLKIINNPEIDIGNKTRYISLLQTEIEQIETVDDKELWSLLLEEKLVKYSESNILSYFFLSKNGLDSFLVQFINNCKNNLKFDTDSINNDFGENAALDFFKAIVTCNELNNEIYQSILCSLNRHFPSFSLTGIDEDKILVLIKLKIIQMSEDSLIFMRAHYPNQLMPFITRNIKQYTEEVINQENFDLNEMVSLLEEKINDKYKVRLLGFTSEGISLKQKGYSDAVKLHILNHNLDADDIPFLLECYPKESIDVKTAIKSIAIEYITDILEAQYSIPFELHLELLRSDQLEIETKKELFALCLPDMSVTQAKECLNILQMDEFLSLFSLKRPRIKINRINKLILSIFKEKRWITKFEIDENDSDFYRAYGRKILDDNECQSAS